MVNEIIHKASVMDNDTLHLIDDNLDETITYLNHGLKKSEEIRNNRCLHNLLL